MKEIVIGLILFGLLASGIITVIFILLNTCK